MYHIIALTIGYLLDLIIGDPMNFPHPIRLIGSFISKLDHKFMDEKVKEKNREAGKERVLGVKLGVYVITVTILVTAIISAGAYAINPYLGIGIEAVLTCYILAAKSLSVESSKVYKALKANDTEKARKAVSMIVGRDTEKLDDEGIAKAAVETVAENTSDGVIAPLLYTAIGGPVLGFAYKAINTLDSMVGYHNDRYENFGSFSARLDDIVNFIPARISAGLMIISAYICGVFNGIYSGKRAVKIFKRDRFNHKSPNSAQTESVCAGALGIKLAGDASYFGKLVKKPYIGDAERNIENEDIKRAGRLMFISEFICFVFCTLALFWLNIAVL